MQRRDALEFQRTTTAPLDRASLHGFADIVAMLLAQDPNLPLTQENEFGGWPTIRLQAVDAACGHGPVETLSPVVERAMDVCMQGLRRAMR